MANIREQQALEAIRTEMEGLPGHLGFYYKNLVTGDEYSVQGDEAFLAASVIKLPLFLHVLARAAAGEIDLQQRLTVTEEEKLPSCGALSLFTGAVEVDVHTLCRLMICLSDNTATNKLIRLCTMEGASAGFRAMGLKKTILRRLLFDSEASARGIQNDICPREMGMLLEQLHREEFVNAQVSREAISVLKRQQINHKMNGKLCGAARLAHKTGEDDQLSNDVGIVYAPQPFVVCWAGHDTDVYPWEDLIRRGTEALYRAQV
ncbi:MAG: serine hydrolase [Clostridia bacterium]|nr:serine hydrolase [Clostridia bacterium]